MCPTKIQSRFTRYMPENGNTRELLTMGLAEAMGTSMLLFFGCMGGIGTLGIIPTPLQMTLTFGFVVMIIIQIFGHISTCHINPAISIGSLVLGKKTVGEVFVYIVCQTLGAILGFASLKIMMPSGYLSSKPLGNWTVEENFCVTDLNHVVNPAQGLLLEIAATATLMLVCCAVWDRRNESNTDSVAIKFGFTITGLATAVGPLTGCGMNPARSLATALINNYWTNQWIYILGPSFGAFIAAFGYSIIFSPKNEETTESTPEAVPLNSLVVEEPTKNETK